MTKKRGPTNRSDDLQLRFGFVIRQIRRRLGISQEELGWRAGLHRTYITDVERGVRNISIRSIASLAEALDVSVSNLFASAAEIPASKLPKRARSSSSLVETDGMTEVGRDGHARDGYGKDGKISKPSRLGLGQPDGDGKAPKSGRVD